MRRKGKEMFEEVMKAVKGKVIEEVKVDDNEIIIIFRDSLRLHLWDGEQQCCEFRYLSTDDNLSAHKGAEIISVELEESGEYSERPEYSSRCNTIEEDDPMFLKILTTAGLITVCTHNIHNGYYGGFDIRWEVENV